MTLQTHTMAVLISTCNKTKYPKNLKIHLKRLKNYIFNLLKIVRLSFPNTTPSAHEVTQNKILHSKNASFPTIRKLWISPNTSVSKTTLTWILSLCAATLPTDYLLMIYASFQKPEQAGTNQTKRENWIPEGITTEIPITLMRSLGAGRPIKPLLLSTTAEQSDLA